MNNIPFPSHDGREEKTKVLRSCAYNLLGGKDEFEKSSYIKKSLACKASLIAWIIDSGKMTNGEISQSTNTYMGLCKLILDKKTD